MDIDRFVDSPVGRLVPITVPYAGSEVEHYAFVPDPLPNEISLSESTLLDVSEADQRLGILEGAAGALPNKDLLVRPMIRREAVSTSALEGTYAGLSEVLEAEVSESLRARSEVLEVLNYAAAAEQALDAIEHSPISLNLILRLHSTLIAGTRGDSADTGRVRSVQVMIGPQGAPPTRAHFIPPPPGESLDDALRTWEAWNYAPNPISPVVRAALSHYQFEAIHPFRDGNGRLGRLLAILLLIERGPLSAHLFSLSPFLEARRDEYGQRLRAVSGEGDFDGWVGFFARAIAEQARLARDRVHRLLGWRQDTVDRLRSTGLRGTAIVIAESLIGYPVVTPSRASEQFNVTYRAANRAVGRLVDEGVLSEVTGQRYGRVFAAIEVLSILDS